MIGGHAGNVEAVLVEGKPVKWGGKLVSADVGRARALLAASCQYLYDAAAKVQLQ